MNFAIDLEVDWFIFIMFFINASIAAFPAGILLNGILCWIKNGQRLDETQSQWIALLPKERNEGLREATEEQEGSVQGLYSFQRGQEQEARFLGNNHYDPDLLVLPSNGSR